MPSVIAIDPGQTTGIAWSDLESPEEILGVDEIRFKSSKWWNDPATATVMKILGRVRELECRTVIIEDNSALVVSPGMRGRLKKSSLIPVRIEAMLSFALDQKWADIDLVRQSPSDKTVMTDVILRKMGVFQKGRRHANDAIRHIIIWHRRQETKARKRKKKR